MLQTSPSVYSTCLMKVFLFYLKLELMAKTLNANCTFRAPFESPSTACTAVDARFISIVV